MTDTRNIAIIGAGVVGLCAARALAHDGHAVTIYDPAGFPAQNASAMAGGMLAPYAEIEHMDGAWTEAGLRGIALWEEMAGDIPGPLGFVRKGSLLIAHPEDAHMLERFRAHLPGGEKSWDYINPSRIEKDIPALFRNALYLSEEAHIEPGKAMDFLCASLRGQVDMIPEAAMPGELTGRFDFVVDSRGYAAAADDPALRGVKGEILLVRNPEFSLSRPVRLMHPRYPLYIVPRDDHIFMIGATNIESAGGTQVSLRSAMELMSALYSLHSSFGEAEIVDIRAGIRPAYPDNLPRIGLEGTIIRCNGLFRHGWLLAPVMAEIVADHVAGQENRFTSLFTGESHESDRQRHSL